MSSTTLSMDISARNIPVREPNEGELDQLREFIWQGFVKAGLHKEDAYELTNETLQGAYIAIFANYVGSGPGCWGKVMSVIYADPCFSDVFWWPNNRRIERLVREGGGCAEEEQNGYITIRM